MKIIKVAHNMTPQEIAQRAVEREVSGMSFVPIYEMIQQFQAVLNGNDSGNIRSYYPHWTEEDFKLVIKLLQPFADMSADMREEELKNFTV